MAHLKNNSESLYNHLMYWGIVQLGTLCCKKEFYKGNRVKRKAMKKKSLGS